MAAAFDDLTEKEKEALRLLLAGHDAKSSARELDISVHTVNDRLRNARRKMGVSSSREAARILGDAEGSAPQTHVHKAIGIEPNSLPNDDENNAEEADRGNSAPAWRHKGVLIMSISASILALTAIAMVTTGSSVDEPATVASNGQGTDVSEPASAQPATPETTAMAWLALIDNGFADESRAEAAAALRERYSAQIWELGISLRLNNMGAPISRRLLSVESTSETEDGALGDFHILIYETDFADSSNALEELVLMREDGEWRVADYDLVTADRREAS